MARIFSPEDGQRLGLAGMINSMIEECDVDLSDRPRCRSTTLLGGDVGGAGPDDHRARGGRSCPTADRPSCTGVAAARAVPVLGITGTGGSGKSSLTDELVRRLRLDQEDKVRVAVLAIDPTRRRGGGALLGDRIRMNAIDSPQVYFRSLATRSTDRGGPRVRSPR